MSSISISVAPLLLPALDGSGKVIIEAPVKEELVEKHYRTCRRLGSAFNPPDGAAAVFSMEAEQAGELQLGQAEALPNCFHFSGRHH